MNGWKRLLLTALANAARRRAERCARKTEFWLEAAALFEAELRRQAGGRA